MSTPKPLLTEEMRQQAIGRETTPLTGEIEKGAIIKFARAIGDDNPFFNDEETAAKGPHGALITPPTFLRTFTTVRPELPFDLPLDRLLDGGSDWEYFVPIKAGDKITAVGRITDLTERTGRLGVMVFMTVVVTYTNQNNEVAATQTSTSLRY